MSKPIRHLHRDYHTAFCGRDATHILMTYDASETNCAACRRAKAAAIAAEAKEKAAAEAAGAKRLRDAEAAAEKAKKVRAHFMDSLKRAAAKKPPSPPKHVPPTMVRPRRLHG